jgi:hypothetical protein
MRFTATRLWNATKSMKTMVSKYRSIKIKPINLYNFLFFIFKKIFILLLFICAYNAWVISPPNLHPLPYHPLHTLPLPPTPSLLGRHYFALISKVVEERV